MKSEFEGMETSATGGRGGDSGAYTLQAAVVEHSQRIIIGSFNRRQRTEDRRRKTEDRDRIWQQ